MKKLILMCLLCAGCAVTPTPQSAAIVQTRNGGDVHGCKFIDQVIGLRDAMSNDDALKYAKTYAMNQAAALGATHIVWSSLDSWAQRGKAVGDAYACPRSGP